MTQSALFDRIEALAGSLDCWLDYSRLLADCLDQIPNAFAAAPLFLRLAAVNEERLGDDEQAIRYFQMVLQTELDNKIALKSLDRLYLKGEQWSLLASNIEAQAQYAEDEERPELLFRLAELGCEHLSQETDALRHLEEVLEYDDAHEGAKALLERQLPRAENRAEVGRLLEGIYLNTEDFQKLHDLNGSLVYEIENSAQQFDLFVRLAELAEEQLESKSDAYRWLAEAFILQPLDEELREKSAHLARELSCLDDWSQRLRGALANCDDAHRQLELSVELGSLEFEDLHRDEDALNVMQHVLEEFDPVNLKALEVLDALYTKHDDVDGQIKILQVRADVVVEDDQRIELKLRLGSLLEGRERFDETITVLEEVVELDGDNLTPLTNLEHLYTRLSLWQELLENLQKQIALVEGEAAEGELFAKMARVAGEQLDRPDEAIEYWTEVLTRSPSNSNALNALEDLYQRTESWRELVDILERQVTLAPGESHREQQLYEKLASIWGEKLDREEKPSTIGSEFSVRARA